MARHPSLGGTHANSFFLYMPDLFYPQCPLPPCWVPLLSVCVVCVCVCLSVCVSVCVYSNIMGCLPSPVYPESRHVIQIFKFDWPFV